MFTGIVKELGVVRSLARTGDIYKLDIRSSVVADSVDIGDSVAVNGVCLTVVKKGPGLVSFDMMVETARKSYLEEMKIGDVVNLEDSLRAGGSIGGHFVQGHIDCVGKITDIKRSGECSVSVTFPRALNDLVVEKGSIAIDGVSLTVGHVQDGLFSVYLIPHTLKMTNLGSKKVGEPINLEFDILGKYVAKLMSTGRRGGVTESFMREHGF